MGWFWMVGFIDVQTLTQYTQYIQHDMAPHTDGMEVQDVQARDGMEVQDVQARDLQRC
jgi:hypothetical protein